MKRSSTRWYAPASQLLPGAVKAVQRRGVLPARWGSHGLPGQHQCGIPPASQTCKLVTPASPPEPPVHEDALVGGHLPEHALHAAAVQRKLAALRNAKEEQAQTADQNKHTAAVQRELVQHKLTRLSTRCVLSTEAATQGSITGKQRRN